MMVCSLSLTKHRLSVTCMQSDAKPPYAACASAKKRYIGRTYTAVNEDIYVKPKPLLGNALYVKKKLPFFRQDVLGSLTSSRKFIPRTLHSRVYTYIRRRFSRGEKQESVVWRTSGLPSELAIEEAHM